MFALASRSFDEPSQTFVRLHAERLAPGETVFLSRKDVPRGLLDGPVMVTGHMPPVARASDEKPIVLGNALSRWIRGKPEDQIARFLSYHGVRTLLAEFGPQGVAMRRPARKAGVDLFVHFHGFDASRLLREEKWLASYPKLFAAAKGVFAPSQFIAGNLIGAGCPAEKITVTPCGIEPSDFPLSERIAGRCLAVGRFVDKKAPQITLRAFAAAAKNRPDAHLDFVGDGPLLDECKAIAADTGIGRQITFHGSLDHVAVRELMAEASLFLQHSVTGRDGDTEGLPVAILEAMGSGLCVISTRHSGIPEAIEDGRHGLLCDEHDEVAMARNLKTALADRDLASGLGDAARVRVQESFTVDRSIRLLRQAMGLGDA
ncbi:glycosyltransferase [Aestuariibius insulae]|uniref:glycosyltransferase n=1 Tax=Aestuariibius insulae TaxID=2058287 RepID=UPI00345E9603